MKKLLLTITSCFMFLLCIPFSASALIYNGSLSDVPNLNDLMLNKIHELYNSSNNYSNIIIYKNPSGLAWSYDIISFDSSNNNITIRDRFYFNEKGEITSINNDILTFNLNIENTYIFYLKYDNKIIYKNVNLNYTNSSDNYLLLSTSYENIVRSQSIAAAANPRNRYYSYVDYDIHYTIKGHNFDVYYLIDNSYQLIQRNLNTFTIYNHESKSKFKDSSIQNDYPDYPTIPSDSIKTFQSSFKLNNFYFVINDEIDLNTIIVKAPETDSLLSDGNSNSQSTTSNNNQSNQLLDNTVNQMNTLENGFKNDLNSNLNNINSNDFNISGISQLSNAANFVRVQFDNLTKNNPFGTILGFSLFLGLSLLIIGKRL